MKTKQLKAKKTKTSKPANKEGKPKRSLNVYNLFFAIERQKIIAEQKKRATVDEYASHSSRCKDDQANVGFANLARIVSERWKAIDPVYKMELEEKARLDKIRFDNEMKLWCAKKEAEERHERTEHSEDPDVIPIPSNAGTLQSFNALLPSEQSAADSSAPFYNNFQSHPVSIAADLNEAKAFFQALNSPPQLNFLSCSTHDSSVPQSSDAIESPSVPDNQRSTNIDQEIAELSRHYGLNMATKMRKRHRPKHSLDDYTFVYEAEEDQHQPAWCDVFPSAAAQEFPYSRHKIVSHDGPVSGNPVGFQLNMVTNSVSPVDGGFHFSDFNDVALLSMYSSKHQGPALVSPTQGHMISSLPNNLLRYQGSNTENRGSMPSAMAPLPYAPVIGNARDPLIIDKPSSEEIGKFITSILSL